MTVFLSKLLMPQIDYYSDLQKKSAGPIIK